jgi:dipeptidase D
MNLDSETEGEMYVGCAGGIDANIDRDVMMEKTPDHFKGYRLFISGLKGGHSGMDINLGRATANKLITRILMASKEAFAIRISSIHGGNMRNAIAREAEAIIAVAQDKTAGLEQLIKQCAATLQKEFANTEPDLSITLTGVDTPAEVLAPCCDTPVLQLAYAIPHGVLRMSSSVPDLVETSNNFSIFTVENGKMFMANLIRSSVNSAKDAVGKKVKAIAELAGARISLTGGYPGWNPNINSLILKTATEVYKKKYGQEPKIMAIHAGLECGLFGVNYDWDMISFGPTIEHPHSPDERVNIASVGKFWDFLTELIQNIPE